MKCLLHVFVSRGDGSIKWQMFEMVKPSLIAFCAERRHDKQTESRNASVLASIDVVLLYIVVFISRSCKTAECWTILHCPPSPFSSTDRSVFDPTSTPEAPSSWPPRHASTRLGPTCVADHVVSFPAGSPSTPVRNRVVTPVMPSGTSTAMHSLVLSET